MFEKFTERARKVMNIARAEALRLNSEFIGTEHILFGIVQEGGGVAAKVLKNLNVDFRRVRQEIERLLQPNPTPTVTPGHLPFSARAKRMLELAQEAVTQLGHDVIGTEHLLLGLLKENEGIAGMVLHNLKVRPSEVHDMVIELLGDDGPDQPAPVRETDLDSLSAALDRIEAAAMLLVDIESRATDPFEQARVKALKTRVRELAVKLNALL